MGIKINGLTLQIGETQVCDSLNVNFECGESWAILGVNGVGKSTLLHTLIDLESKTSDVIRIDDMDLTAYRKNRKLLARKTGILLQDYEYNFTCTVIDAVLVGRHPFAPQWQWNQDHDISIAENALNIVGLSKFRDRTIDTLSGGEKRRMNIATLLAQDPTYFLMDEPTNHLDLHAQITLLDMMKSHIREKNRTTVMVMHDANLAKRYSEKTLLLFGNGHWMAGDSEALINKENLERLYGCAIQTYVNNKTTVYLPG